MPIAPDNGNYEIERQRHAQALYAQLPSEVEKVAWPLERLHAIRDGRLRALVRVAKECSPWHARRLNHVDPDKLRGDDLSAIPPMTKADLMANWDEIVTDRRLTLELANTHLARVASEGPAYLLGEYHVIASGGASGTRGVFVWDFEGWLNFFLTAQRSIVWLEQRTRRIETPRWAWVMAANPTHATGALARTFAPKGAQGSNRSFPVILPIAEIVAGLNAFQPTHISAYPSMMHRLALEASAGRLRIAPAILTCGAEPLLPEARRVIEEAFGAPPINTYACSEAGVIARSYPRSSGLHLTEDIAVYEPVDVHNNPVPAGTPAAKLLVTNVINGVLPLIRYELTDEVTFLTEPNPDPWTGRRIADVQGRLDDVFVYPGGVEVHPHVFRSTLGRLPAIFEYQVRQTPRGANIAVRSAVNVDLETIRQELAAELTRLGLNNPELTMIMVERLERQGSVGKLRRFIPL